MSVTEIAGSCGFNSASYYTEVFNKITGMTPRDYRAQKRLKTDLVLPL
jgi:AraC-like DNA-binding protein